MPIETDNAVGIATIEVFPENRVLVTRRVRSIFGGVAWRVRNKTSANITVCVRNFTRVSPLDQADLGRSWLLQTEDCTSALQPRKAGWIIAEFDGEQGDVYTYDVYVNNAAVADPELEI